MTRLDRLREVARRLRLLDAEGALMELDSLSVVDLVVELERTLQIKIPATRLRHDRFRSLETIDAFLTELGAG